VRRSIVPKEQLLVSGISLHPFGHRRGLQQGQVGRQLEKGGVSFLGKKFLFV